MIHSLCGERRAAFTLIEILVVLSIIAVLAAILFPVFSRARENARRASCQSNLKQISLGAQQYIQDYDERFPLGLVAHNVMRYSTSFDLLQPYLKNPQIGICPSDGGEPDVDMMLPGTLPVSYKANTEITTSPDLGEPSPPSVAEIEHSDRLPLIWDAVNVSSNPFAPNVITMRRHHEGANCSFADGHVKWIKAHPDLWDSAAGAAAAQAATLSGIPGTRSSDYWDIRVNAR